MGCGCSLPFTGALLLALTVVLAVIIARDDGLRRSPLWLVLVPLVVGLFALYFRVRRSKGPE